MALLRCNLEIFQTNNQHFNIYRERERQRNLERAAPGTRSKLERNRERDISEQIALGLPAKTAAAQGSEGLFDSRLFNQSRGLNSGYDDDESYNVYSQPWRNESSIGNNIYRPGKNIDKEAYGGAEDLENLKKTSRFVADKGFELNKFVLSLRAKKIPWKDLFWKLFACVIEFHCIGCD